MSLATRTRLGPYEIVGLLGAGGMGEVYRAKDTRLGRLVALKVLPADVATDADRLARFAEEARTVSALNHPNIITIYDVGVEPATPYVVFELLQGMSLRVALEDHRISTQRALAYAAQIADGLGAAHEHGIIHRDLKPENVFIARDGRVKILDFGLAKVIAPVAVSGTTALLQRPETQPGAVLGTVGYMSPEQVRGGIVDHRSDLFSLGTILYEMLAGRRAFQGASSAETMSAIATQDPLPLGSLNPNLPHGIEPVVRRCLEKNVDARFQSARDLAFALEGASTAPGSTSSIGHSEPGRLRRWLERVAYAATIFLLVGTAFVIGRLSSALPRGRLEATGPVREPVITRLTANPSERYVHSSAISPDGKYLAYEDNRGIQILDIDSGDTQPLHDSSEKRLLGWSGDSTRVRAISLEGTVPWGWELSVLGTTVRRVPPFVQTALTRFPSWDEQHVMILEKQSLWVQRPDTSDRKLLATCKERNCSFGSVFCWTPDSKRIFFAEFDSNGESAIKVVSIAGGDPTEVIRFRDQRLYDVGMAFPDGRLISIFNEPSGRSLAANQNLWQMWVDPVSGRLQRGPEQLTHWNEVDVGSISGSRDGRRLTVLRTAGQSDVYVARLQHGGITSPKRLTLDDRDDLPTSWMIDNKHVVFTSFRNGSADVFMQDVDADTPIPLATGPGFQGEAHVTSDGQWILYSAGPPDGRGTADRIMRVPLAGGEAALVIQSDAYVGHSCALSGPCFLVERRDGEDTVSLLEPFKKGRQLFKMQASNAIDMSPDGTRMAVIMPTGIPMRQIRIVRLDGTVDHEISVPAGRHFWTLNWAADGRTLYVGDSEPQGFALLEIDVASGASKMLWAGEGPQFPRAIPSRDGKQIAILGGSQDSNVWMLEKF
jgi:serine/threonine protein kinase